jgi:hypothetical protein
VPGLARKRLAQAAQGNSWRSASFWGDHLPGVGKPPSRSDPRSPKSRLNRIASGLWPMAQCNTMQATIKRDTTADDTIVVQQ